MTSRKKESSFSMLNDSIILPRDDPKEKDKRELVSTVVRNTWNAINEWTAALNSGRDILKSMVAGLVGLNNDDKVSLGTLKEAESMDVYITAMGKSVATLEELLEQIQDMQPANTDPPLFSTIPLIRFEEILSYITESYKKETTIKHSACIPLPFTTDTDTLNTSVTLWTTHVHLPQPHLYHIKILLFETGQL